MKIEKIKSKLKKAVNRVIGVLLPVTTLFVSCGTNALVVHAASSNTVKVISYYVNNSDSSTRERSTTTEFSLTVSSDAEIVAFRDSAADYDVLYFRVIANGKAITNADDSHVLNFVATQTCRYKEEITGINKFDYFKYVEEKSTSSLATVNFTVLEGSFKVFDSWDAVKEYASTGLGDYDIIKPDELEKGWYLKNVSYKVTADDSPSSEAGTDATYIHFSWDIDNLQDGDLLEIKTKSYYKKILGEQLSGFHDFITKIDGVSAYEGKYSFSQYEATKAWFNSLENKPLAFKEYDTTDYYLRPYRQGQYGGWVHIKMGRSTPTSSPYIEDIEYGDFDDDNNWTVDEDLTDKNGGHHGVDQGGGYIPPDQSDNPFTGTNIAGIFSYFYDFMKQIPAMLGDLPALVGNIISFLPKPIIAFIGIGVIVAIILRIVGR